MKNVIFILFVLTAGYETSAQRLGTLKGQLYWVPPDSNYSPEKQNIPYNAKPLEIFVHQITSEAEVDFEDGLIHKIYTPIVARFFCKWNGSFKTRLPLGRYSVFVRNKNNFFGNLKDAEGNLSPATIDSTKRTTWVTITIEY